MHRLAEALSGINKDFGDAPAKKEEELVELADVTDAALGEQFNKINDGCSNYFEAVSKDIATVQNGYIQKVIGYVQSVKDILLLRNKDGYSNLKIQLFDVLDAARDVGLKIESAQYRLASNPKKINRFIGKKANWYYQHKYSLKTPLNCRRDKDLVATDEKKLENAFDGFLAKLAQLKQGVAGSITKEQKAKLNECKSIADEKKPAPTEPKYPSFEASGKCKLEEDAEDQAKCHANEVAAHKYKVMMMQRAF